MYEWPLTFLTLWPFNRVSSPFAVDTPQPSKYFCCYFITVVFLLWMTMSTSGFSDGFRWPLWKGHSTFKGVIIHRLRTATFCCSSSVWSSFLYKFQKAQKIILCKNTTQLFTEWMTRYMNRIVYISHILLSILLIRYDKRIFSLRWLNCLYIRFICQA